MSVGELLRDEVPEPLEVLAVQLHVVVPGALQSSRIPRFNSEDKSTHPRD